MVGCIRSAELTANCLQPSPTPDGGLPSGTTRKVFFRLYSTLVLSHLSVGIDVSGVIRRLRCPRLTESFSQPFLSLSLLRSFLGFGEMKTSFTFLS